MTRTLQEARDLNRRSREIAPAGTAEPSPFFCECADERCYASVWLTPDEYDAAVSGGRLMLAPGHSPPDLDDVLREQLGRPREHP